MQYLIETPTPKIHLSNEIIASDFDIVTTKENKCTIEYYNIPCAFDIETTSFYDNEEKRAIMYIWQMCINGVVYVGRTWKDLLLFCHNMIDTLGLCYNKRLVIYIHNLSYEFQFIRKWFEWDNVFAIDSRKVVKALTTSGIEFRCSYLLTGKNLKKVGNDLTLFHVQKMIGDLDYSLKRNSLTHLTNKEVMYCINDVRVVTALIAEKIQLDGDITKIPLTKTSYVRRFVRNKCLYSQSTSHKGASVNNAFKSYRALMKELTITVEEYKMLKRAFQGGFTHANPLWSGEICYNVGSFDFTSSYPYVMLSERYPMSRGRKVKVKDKASFNDYLNKYCCIFDIKFSNLKAKYLYDNYISSSKCDKIINEVSANGRVVSADEIITTITNVDYDIIKSNYTWDKIAIGTMYIYDKEYLPKPIFESLLTLYKDKTTLKGVQGREVDYMLAKENLNSCYGMIVTDICREEHNHINNEWEDNDNINYNDDIDNYNDDMQRVLFYPWGVFVTAYARRNLWLGVHEFGRTNDYIYSDTDSIKCLNPAKHIDFINRYNNMVLSKLKRAAQHHNLSIDEFKPHTQKGVEKLIGVWDNEGNDDYIAYKAFKTLGAKRYMILDNDYKLSITVSGLNKSVTVPYLIAKYGKYGAFKAFNDGLYIPVNSTGKNTHTYVDNEISGYLTDYQGNIDRYNERSYIHLEEQDYTLSVNQSYLDYIDNVKYIIM